MKICIGSFLWIINFISKLLYVIGFPSLHIYKPTTIFFYKLFTPTPHFYICLHFLSLSPSFLPHSYPTHPFPLPPFSVPLSPCRLVLCLSRHQTALWLVTSWNSLLCKCWCCTTRVLHACRIHVLLRKTYNSLYVVHLSDSTRYVREALSSRYSPTVKPFPGLHTPAPCHQLWGSVVVQRGGQNLLRDLFRTSDSLDGVRLI